jgi:small subunit ribosomal protein S10
MFDNLIIQLESYNLKLLNKIILELKNSIRINFFDKIQIIGPIMMPVKKRIYCVLTSPHVNKDAREHFEIRRYKRIFLLKTNDCFDIKTFIKLLKLPAGISFNLK